MDSSIVVGILAMVGTLGGSALGVLGSQKLTDHRLKKLEEKQDKHNNMIERQYKTEGEVAELQHDVRDMKTDIHDIKKDVGTLKAKGGAA